jgi:hypothetical protein
MLRKFLRFATWISIALVVLFWIAAFAVSHQIYRLDPLHFFERGTNFPCVNTGPDIILIVAVLLATTNILLELRKRRKVQTLSKWGYVTSLIVLLWGAAWLLLWFTVGVGFMCGGG